MPYFLLATLAILSSLLSACTIQLQRPLPTELNSPTSQVIPTTTFSLVGSVVDQNILNNNWDLEENQPCDSKYKNSPYAIGQKVEVRDGENKLIALGEFSKTLTIYVPLSEIMLDNKIKPLLCESFFQVNNIPKEQFYTIIIGEQEFTESFEDLEGDGWQIQFTIPSR